MDMQAKKDIINLVESSRDATVCSIDKKGFPNAKTMYNNYYHGSQKHLFAVNELEG